MDSIHNFAPEIQQGISGYLRYLSREGFRRPVVKNVGALLHGMLKKHDVHVSVLGRSLEEPISPKKTEERLQRNLRRDGLGERLIAAHGRKNGAAIRRKRYCIIDLSDIQKRYATQMEGLCRVRDGDQSTHKTLVIGNGYWWLNAVMADETGVVPVYSEVYSLDYEGHARTSENTKILGAVRAVHAIHPEAVHVLDRGGDRSAILDSMCDGGRQFIIRGQNQRSLRLHRDSAQATNIKELARRVRLTTCYRSSRGEVFDVGMRRVYYGDIPLWLVVSKRRRGGLSWYLTNVDGSRAEIMNTVMEGYGLRWRIEEYHRQIKQDYGLESIRLRSYTAIRNMGVLVMLAASFCARLPDHMVIKMIAMAGRLPRRRLSDMPAYPLYMIVAAVALVLETTVKRRPKPLRIRKREFCQLTLNFRTF